MWQHDWGKWTSTPIDPGISVYRNPLNETQLVAVGRSVSVSLHLSLGVFVSLCLYNPMSWCLGVSVSLPLLLSFVLGLKMDAPTSSSIIIFTQKAAGVAEEQREACRVPRRQQLGRSGY